MKSSKTSGFCLVVFLCSSLFLVASCASKQAAEPEEPDYNVGVYGSSTYFTAEPGESVPAPISGTIAQIGGTNLPAPFDKDSIVIDGTMTYWLDGEKVLLPVQFLLGNVSASDDVCVGLFLDGNSDEGIAIASGYEVNMNVRCQSYDPFLAMAAMYDGIIPQFDDGWYYYGIAGYQYMTELEFQPLADADTGYEFWDCPESLREIHDSGYSNYLENGSTLSNYPGMAFVIEAVLDEYPSSVGKFSTDVSPMQRIMIGKQFDDMQSISLVWDGVPLQVFCEESAVEDLHEYYTLGETVWLYLRAETAINGELCCYLWDFSSSNPSTYAREVQEYVAEYMEM